MILSQFLFFFSLVLGLGLFGYVIWRVVTGLGGRIEGRRMAGDDALLHRILDEVDQLRTQNSILTERLERIEGLLRKGGLPPPGSTDRAERLSPPPSDEGTRDRERGDEAGRSGAGGAG
jgi:hypothetical protein